MDHLTLKSAKWTFSETTALARISSWRSSAHSWSQKGGKSKRDSIVSITIIITTIIIKTRPKIILLFITYAHIIGSNERDGAQTYERLESIQYTHHLMVFITLPDLLKQLGPSLFQYVFPLSTQLVSMRADSSHTYSANAPPCFPSNLHTLPQILWLEFFFYKK